jgi:hypothetical protein
LGFRSDIAHIKDVHALDDVVVNERLGNVAFTPAEADELEVRLDLEKDGDVLQAFFAGEPEPQEAFGGIYLEHAAGAEDHTVGGKLVLPLVRGHERVDEILARLPPLQYPERLRIERVEFSDAHLRGQPHAIPNVASRYLESLGLSIDRKSDWIDVLIVPSDVAEGA